MIFSFNHLFYDLYAGALAIGKTIPALGDLNTSCYLGFSVAGCGRREFYVIWVFYPMTFRLS